MTQTEKKQFEPQVAIVTGGKQGLAAALATLLARRGAAGLVICGRNRAKGEARVASIAQQTGNRFFDVPADLNRVEDCRDVVAEAEADRSFGRVDTLVNATGMTDRAMLLDTGPELHDQMCASNVRAPFFLSQDCVKLMLRQPIVDTIVNIGSMPALAGSRSSRPAAP